MKRKYDHRILRRAAVVAAAVALFHGSAAGTAAEEPAAEPPTRVAPPVPSFALKDLAGKTVRRSDFDGRPLLICFLASWDEFSEEQMPILVQVHKEFANQKLVVIGIALDSFGTSDPARKSRSAVEMTAWASEHGIQFPLLWADKPVIADFGGLSAIPTTLVVDRNHNVIDKHVGVADLVTLKQDLATVIGP